VPALNSAHSLLRVSDRASSGHSFEIGDWLFDYEHSPVKLDRAGFLIAGEQIKLRDGEPAGLAELPNRKSGFL
jgi:hypothetical protein